MSDPGADPVRIRAAGPVDAPALAELLNRIIDEGDKTAIEGHLSATEFAEWFLSGPHSLTCVVAGDEQTYLGFQVMETFHDDLPSGCADVATFVSRRARGRGVGTALMQATVARAQDRNVHTLRAVVRRSSHGAVAYYRTMGFSEPEYPRDGPDGLIVTLMRPLAPRP